MLKTKLEAVDGQPQPGSYGLPDSLWWPSLSKRKRLQQQFQLFERLKFFSF
jgi:hypothetical protein